MSDNPIHEDQLTEQSTQLTEHQQKDPNDNQIRIVEQTIPKSDQHQIHKTISSIHPQPSLQQPIVSKQTSNKKTSINQKTPPSSKSSPLSMSQPQHNGLVIQTSPPTHHTMQRSDTQQHLSSQTTISTVFGSVLLLIGLIVYWVIKYKKTKLQKYINHHQLQTNQKQQFRPIKVYDQVNASPQ